jgi:hypothetical protein
MAANDYVTLANLKLYLRITSTDANDDTALSDLITQASRAIDNYTGRRFYSRTQTRGYDTPGYERTDYWRAKYVPSRTLRLDDDLLAVTSITNGDGSSISGSAYNLTPNNEVPVYEIRLRPSSGITWLLGTNGDAEQVISVVGTWGYVDRTASDYRSLEVIADTELACKIICKAYYDKRFGQSTEGAATITGAGVVIRPSSIPTDAKLILDRYKRFQLVGV